MYLTLVFTTVLLGSSYSANVNKHLKMLSIIDNNSIEDDVEAPTEPVLKKFVVLAHKPRANYTHSNQEALELMCETLGSPSPSIRWFKNDAPVYEYDIESTEMLGANTDSVGRLISTLLVAKTVGQDRYTCLATAGSKSAMATTIVSSNDGGDELAERSKLVPQAPRIVVYYKMIVDRIGKNIVLPCRAKGHPKPQVTWVDSRGETVKNNHRMKVLRSGELVISPLSWNDLGEFVCHATNSFGSQHARTFIYPAKAG